MRDYGKVSPHFWTGTTGKKLRQTHEGLIVAMYLMTSPHANMLGLYYMPLYMLLMKLDWALKGLLRGFKEPVKRGFVAMTKPRRQSGCTRWHVFK